MWKALDFKTKCEKCGRKTRYLDLTIYGLCTVCRDAFMKTKAYEVLQEAIKTFGPTNIVADYTNKPITATVQEGHGAGIMNPTSWSFLVVRGKEKSELMGTEEFDVGSVWTGYKREYKITVEQEKFSDSSSIAILLRQHTKLDYTTVRKLIVHFYF